MLNILGADMSSNEPRRKIVGDNSTKPITSTESNDKIRLDVKDDIVNVNKIYHELGAILKQLKIMNIHLSIISDHEIENKEL